jgi:heme oxygenase
MAVVAGIEVAERIRRQTVHLPRRIENTVYYRSIAEGKGTQEIYVAFLEKMWAFLNGFEGRVRDRREWEGLGFDFSERSKLDRLEADLRHFGRHPVRSNGIELPLDGASFGFICGYLYVIESLTMIGQNQFRILSRKLGIQSNQGGAFLSSYGDRAPWMWRQLQEFMDRVASLHQGSANDMVAGAIDAYQRLEAWLKA